MTKPSGGDGGIMLDMATIHITRAEAVRDIDVLLEKAAAGVEIVIESESSVPLLITGIVSEVSEPTDAEYTAWCRAQVVEGLREADDPNTAWLSEEEVTARSLERQAQLLRRIEAKAS
jgi:hypothetical protein